jgi:hypothetical protein
VHDQTRLMVSSDSPNEIKCGAFVLQKVDSTDENGDKHEDEIFSLNINEMNRSDI